MMPFIYLLAVAGATADASAVPALLPMPEIQAYSVAPPPPSPMDDDSRPPRPANSPGSWVNSDDFPMVALRNKQSGTTTFRLEIGVDGRVSNCTIVSSSGSPVLDMATCEKIKQRALFEPARDENGQKTTGSYSNSVRWVLPVGPMRLPEPGVTVTNVDIDEDGNVTRCRYRNMREQSSSWLACPTYAERYAPHLDADGNPAAVRLTVTQSFRVTEIEGNADAGKGDGEE